MSWFLEGFAVQYSLLSIVKMSTVDQSVCCHFTQTVANWMSIRAIISLQACNCSWVMGGIRHDVELYIQQLLILSFSMLICQKTLWCMSYYKIPECIGPWVMMTNRRYQTSNGSWWSPFLCSAFHFHPSPSSSSAQPYLKMKCWSVWEMYLPQNLSFHLSPPDILVSTEWTGKWSNYTCEV